MKPLAILALLITLASCTVGQLTVKVPGGRYVFTLTVFE